MVNIQILEYVKLKKKNNFSDEDIRKELLPGGWKKEEIDEVFLSLNKGEVENLPQKQIFPSQNITQNFLGISNNFNQNQSIYSSSGSGNIPETQVKSKSKAKIVILILAFLAISFSFVAYGYMNGLILPFNNFSNKSFNAFSEIPSFSYDTVLKINVNDYSDMLASLQIFKEPISDYTITLLNSGKINKQDLKNISLEHIFDFVFGEINTNIYSRFVDNQFFLKVGVLPKSILSQTLGQENSLENIENKWFYFKDSEDFVQDYFTRRDVSSLFEEDFLTEEQRTELYEITERASFIKINQRMTPKIINGTLTHHILFEIDIEGIENYLKEISQYLKDEFKEEDFNDYDVDVVSMYNDLFDEFSGELWVGFNDGLIRKAKINFVLKDLLGKDASKNIRFDFEGVFTDWGKDLKVEKPEDAIDFETLIKDVYETREGTRNAITLQADANTKANLSGMRAKAEIFYDKQNTYAGFCNSLGEVGFEFVCRDNANEFLVWAPVSKDFWCIDYEGASNLVNKIPKGFLCNQ